MKNTVNLAKIITEVHERKWVALSTDKTTVVGFDENLVELRKKIGDVQVVFMKVPPADTYLSF